MLEDILKEYKGRDFNYFKALEFEDFIVDKLKKAGAKVERQVWVNDRGDGRRGRIDLVITLEGVLIGIEIDRKKPRAKSKFKLEKLGATMNYIILREPFSIIKLGLI